VNNTSKEEMVPENKNQKKNMTPTADRNKSINLTEF